MHFIALAKLCALLLVPLGSFGQTTPSLFTVIPTEMANLNTEQQTRWNRLSSQQYDVKKIVSVGNLPDYINSEGVLQIDLPDDNCGSVSFRAKTGRLHENGDYYFYGYLSSGGTTCACEDGYFMLQKQNSAVFGEIMIAEQIFQIVNLTGGLNAYVRADTTFLEDRICGTGLESGPSPLNKATQVEAEDRSVMTGCSTVRIVFFYTANAANECDPNEIAAQCVSQANQALLNSAIPQSTLKFANIGVFPISMTESGAPNSDLNTFGPLALAALPTYYADVAVLLTDGGYETVAGLTPSGNIGAPTAGLAYTLVEIKDAVSQKTFTHEIGHVMGCDHQLCSLTLGAGCSSTTTAVNHGFNFKYGGLIKKLRMTMMHQLGDAPYKAKRRILHYSNPSVIYHGKGTGNATANNASWITGSACTVASYQPDPPVIFEVSIKPDNWHPTAGQTIGLQSFITGGTGPFTYSWSAAINNPYAFGIPFSTSVNPSYTLPSPCSGCSVFIRLIVTASDGSTATDVLEITTGPQFSGCGSDVYSSVGDEYTIYVSPKPVQEDFTVFPNPATNQLGVKFQNTIGASELEAEIVDAEGKMLVSKNFHLENARVFEASLDISAVPNGTHFIRLKANGETFTKSIIVLKP